LGFEASGTDVALEGKCEKTLTSFVSRNDALTRRFAFLPLNDEEKKRYIHNRHKTCEVEWGCSSCCRDGLDGYSGYGGEEDVVQGKGIDEKGNLLFNRFHIYRVTVTVCCSGTDSPGKWESTFVHELQHAFDRCNGLGDIDCDSKYSERDAFLSPGVDAQRKNCMCASALCGELRAWQQPQPSKTRQQIARMLVFESSYWSRGHGWVYCDGVAGVTRNEALVELLRSCDDSKGMLPSGEMSFVK
jgi:hypothetical protein